MILQTIYAAKTVVLTVAVATVAGFNPISGFREDVEKIWRKMQKKVFGNSVDGLRFKKKLPVDRSNSVAQLDQLARLQNRRPSDVAVKLAKFKAIDRAAQESAETDDVYSPLWKPPKFDKNDPKYGRPREGSLTEQRGIAAGNHVAKEIIQLCEIIDENGSKNQDGTITITFGQLFSIYVYISDKVVGMLLRARKHGILTFEGEMLYQRQDEKVPITLIKSLDDVREAYAQSLDPAHCLKSLN